MDWKIELIVVPVSDVDKAVSFYRDQVGFTLDIDAPISEDLRFVQLTPPGSACSIAIGTGLSDMPPGSLHAIQVVIGDAAEARQHLLDVGVDASEVDEQAWGKFVSFSDPDGNRWSLQELPQRG